MMMYARHEERDMGLLVGVAADVDMEYLVLVHPVDELDRRVLAMRVGVDKVKSDSKVSRVHGAQYPINMH
jgi:hypothetical protein